ncbi:MAG: PAS domain S-box protein [Longimonas sp.]|uniref:PAS domain-containing protein n=1 Tax=Longimonas sp. TaxID=2039626 RepID=UPI0039750A03
MPDTNTDETVSDVLQRSVILERVTDGIAAFDTGLRCTYLNDPAVQMLGIQREDLIGNRVEDVFPEAEGTVVQDKLAAAMETQKQHSFEHYHAVQERWFEGRIYPDESGMSLYLVDITERKASEEEFAQTNWRRTALIENTSAAVYDKEQEQKQRTRAQLRKHLQSLYEKLPDAVIIHDADGNVLDVNSQTVNDLGYTREELLSMNVTRFEIDHDWDELNDLWSAMEVGDRHKVLTRHCRKDGSTFPAEVWVDKVEIGGEQQFIALSRDVTERNRQRQALEELTEQYRALLENADDAIFLMDVDKTESGPEFRFEQLNPYHEAATGLTTESIRGKTPREAVGPDVGAELAANYRRCVEAEEPISYQETLDLPQGTRIWETKLAPVMIDNEVTRVIGISRDVTDRVEREATLSRQNERLSEFTGVVSHDLRNPLNIAQGRTALAIKERARDGNENIHLPKAQAALKRMEVIIMDTLLLAQQGDTVDTVEPVAMEEIINACWAMIDPVEATLIIEDTCTIAGDPDRLCHVYENLFRNALEHGGPGVTVRVGKAGHASLYVEDDGPGVPPEQQDAVFEPGQTSRADGTGFGLAIVKRIAEAHGWTVTLTASDEGGTRFEFSGVEVISS